MVKSGFRAYLAVHAGIEATEVMGSRSTYPRGKIGGIEGRPLKAGDIIYVGEGENVSPRRLPDKFILMYTREITCHVISGPQAHLFEDLNTFYENPYEVTPKADRMGYRLKGPSLVFKSDVPKSIISEATVPGTVQVPADGQPIILMTEQTVGGYSKIGVITTPDRWRLSQLRPGDIIHFKGIDIESAQKNYRDAKSLLEKIRQVLQLPVP